ncbi:aminotransferase class I/II-fold pyridoxal phosphate-dependent enzyme, partial [Streptococcus pyogenes]
DGLMMAQAQYTRFLHNDLQDLHQKLAHQTGPVALLTESTFSMSGQRAPLSEMTRLLKGKDACMIVDEAHGFGVMGPEGLGGVAAAGL